MLVAIPWVQLLVLIGWIPTYDFHWKLINYKTWDGIFYAHDLDGQQGAISNERLGKQKLDLVIL